MAGTKERLSGTISGEDHRTGELSRLRSNGAASVEELREFMGQMRERKPQEVLGMVAESGLARGIFVATLGCIALLFVLTAIPYWYSEDESANKPAVQPAAAAVATKTATDADTASASTADTAATGDSKTQAAKAMGIGDSKVADPDKNPLDNLDNLLDGVDDK